MLSFILNRSQVYNFAVMLVRPTSASHCSLALVRPVFTLTDTRRLISRATLETVTVPTRSFGTTTRMSAFSAPSSDPPKKEMVYYPDMTTALPSKSAEFRRVLWTGLYSQLVLMTVPVGGDIGEEASPRLLLSTLTQWEKTLS